MKKILYVAFIGASFLGSAQLKVGDNPSSMKSDAVLEVESTSKGFLPPRMDKHARDLILNPEIGLMIYNTDDKCLNTYKAEGWFNYCNKKTTVPQPDFWNMECLESTVSKTACNGQTSIAVDGVNYELVDINGQCWFKDNLKATPSNYPTPLPFTSGEGGWYGFYYNSGFEEVQGEGKFYQGMAAMNGSTQERAQGICPDGFHIPSDCEFKYLENSLGMSVVEQNTGGGRWRGTDQGTKLKSTVGLQNQDSGGTDETGFDLLLPGALDAVGYFDYRGTTVDLWTSTTNTNTGFTSFYFRTFGNETGKIYRSSQAAFGAGAFVRCLKN